MKHSNKIVIGIDLAGSEKRPTGICILIGDRINTSILYTDEEILNEVEKYKGALIAVDAPLTLPKGRKSIDQRCDIHFRECDRELLRRRIKFFPITLGPMRSLTKRGMKLKKELENRGFEVIEVYPGGAQDILGIPRKSKGKEKLLEGLKKLGLKGFKKDMTDHELDAVTAAYVGKLYLEGNYEAYGDPKEGLIIMPRAKISDKCSTKSAQ